MPDFDGTGPLKRGRIIGRGMGNCNKDRNAIPCTNRENGEYCAQKSTGNPE